MKLCDLTQFYSPRSGGVKRYLHEKIAYLQAHAADDQHLLVVPGSRTEVTETARSRLYSVASPMVSRSTRYRALLNLRAIDEIIAHEQPDVIESADPYQLGWAAAEISRRRRIPAVAFYHSDFAEAYLRLPAERLGPRIATAVMSSAQRYVRELYNRFELTFAPSQELAERLRKWGVRNVRVADLGVNTDVFKPTSAAEPAIRAEHSIPASSTLLMYVGRLAPEKNTATLFKAFDLLTKRRPGAFQLLVVGDGQQRNQLQQLQTSTGAVTWLPYCADAAQLARLYRAADLFVHPGTQETFGLVALESQACGTPVLGIQGSAMDRIIMHDQSAWARENSPEALAHAVEKSLTCDFQAMGAFAATAVVARYSWRRVFDDLFCVYRQVCADYTARA